MRAPGIMSAIAHGVYVGLTGDLSRTTETRLALMEALQSMSAMPFDRAEEGADPGRSVSP